MEEKIKNSLRSFLADKPGIKLVYLIGSVAQDRQRRDSDLDLVLVMEEETAEKFAYGRVYQKIQSIIDHPNLDLRVVVPQKADLLYLKQVIDGQLIYSQSEEYRIAFEKKVMLRYFDTQHIRDIFHYYLNERIQGGSYGQ